MASFGYPEILLSVLFFLVLRLLTRKKTEPLTDWPLFGMLPGILLRLNQIHDFITQCFLLTGSSNFLFKGPWFCNMNMLLSVDPANVHYVMTQNFSNFPKGPEFKKIFDFLGDGIFNIDSSQWKVQRRIAQGLITSKQFHRFLVRTNREKVEKGLVPVLERASKEGLVVDLQDVLQRFTFDSTCILVTGYDPGCLSPEFPVVRFAEALDEAEEGIIFRHILPESIWKLQRWAGIGKEGKMKEARKTLDGEIASYVSMKREELGRTRMGSGQREEDNNGVDLLTSYMDEETTLGIEPDDKFLRDTILTFLIAGRDTTSSALTWFFWLVSKHPLVERKIREELKSVTNRDDPENWWLLGGEKLNDLVYLHGALCESLRLYPPVPFEHKAPVRPDVLPSGHSVDPNMKILFPLYAMGRMTSVWGEDCLEFKPERWVTEQGRRIRREPSYKFVAFNAGPRTCLGKEVAFVQMKGIAASVLHRYNVQVVEGHPVVPDVSIILHAKHGLKVRVSKRWD